MSLVGKRRGKDVNRTGSNGLPGMLAMHRAMAHQARQERLQARLRAAVKDLETLKAKAEST